jgi:two-component system, chemotaxis family, chemotaxis protein CheY
MRVLVVEDDFLSRNILRDLVSTYGVCDIAVDGEEAVMAFGLAWEDGAPYDLIFMDIKMPGLNGLEAVKLVRAMERERGISSEGEAKIIMTTALGDPKTVFEAYNQCGATSYVVKPISREKVVTEVRKAGLID